MLWVPKRDVCFEHPKTYVKTDGLQNIYSSKGTGWMFVSKFGNVTLVSQSFPFMAEFCKNVCFTQNRNVWSEDE